MLNTQVTVPTYRENPLIVPFIMLCPGISQVTKHHHLNMYKGKVWREKSYVEICNHNVVNILYDPLRSYLFDGDILEKNGKLHVPPIPGWGFISDETQIPWDSEILQSFAKLTNITNFTFIPFDFYGKRRIVIYQIEIGSMMCSRSSHVECVPSYRYYPWYIWTKEGLKIRK